MDKELEARLDTLRNAIGTLNVLLKRVEHRLDTIEKNLLPGRFDRLNEPYANGWTQQEGCLTKTQTDGTEIRVRFVAPFWQWSMTVDGLAYADHAVTEDKAIANAEAFWVNLRVEAAAASATEEFKRDET
jgi:hypothetical protein